MVPVSLPGKQRLGSSSPTRRWFRWAPQALAGASTYRVPALMVMLWSMSPAYQAARSSPWMPAAT